MKKRIVVVVLGICFNKKGQILLTQRNQPLEKQVHKKWQLPGGAMEFGETPEKTLKREMKEEIGVDVKIIERISYTATNFWKYKKFQCQCLFLSFLTKITKGKPNSKNFETYHLDWFYPKDIKKLKSLPKTNEIISAALSLIKKHL
jgi:8-oxo-dGTP diphosphatase